MKRSQLVEGHPEPIATVTRSSFQRKFGTPRQGALSPESRAFIKLSSRLPKGSTSGLEGFSHLWLLSWFHENHNKKTKGKILPPRLQGASMGVLATRSPHRFNPIGLTLVKLESVEDDGLWVSGIDLIDATPILDIKPYIREDVVEGARFGWLEDVASRPISINWSVDLEKVRPLTTVDERLRLQNVIETSLKLDPLPLAYKKKEAENPGRREPYGMTLENLNVVFNVTENGFDIIDITAL